MTRVLVRAAAGLVSLAHASDIVVVMAAGAPAITKDRVANVYVGRNMELRPVDLPEASPLRSAFYKKATDRDPAQIKAVWSRITFTGQGRPPKEMADAKAVKLAVAADRTAIGYIDRADVDSSVSIVLDLN
jgi:hypothetical protein